MTLREQVENELDGLTEMELRYVADYVAHLKGQGGPIPESMADEMMLRALYAESTDEDRSLAEAGMSDYSDGLAHEDQQ
ncbi:MAG: hypothetical protein WD894_17740 [Pirellulales bacterium]